MTKDDYKDGSDISPREAKKLAAYLDGELSDRGMRKLKDQIRDSEAGDLYLSELEELRGLRQELRNWFVEETLDENGVRHSVDIWEQIEGRLERYSEGRGGIFQRIGEWIDEALTFRGISWSPHSFLAGLAAMLFVVFLGTQFYGQKSEGITNIALQNGAINNRAMPIRQVSSKGSESLLFGSRLAPSAGPRSLRSPVYVGVVDSTNDLFVLFSPEENGVSRQREIRSPGSLRLRVPVSEVMGPRAMGDGFRAGGVDIDWIKSDKAFKILSTKSQASPPVIWVAER